MIGSQRVGLKRGVSSCGQWLEICSFTTRKIVRDLVLSLPDFALSKENLKQPCQTQPKPATSSFLNSNSEATCALRLAAIGTV